MLRQTINADAVIVGGGLSGCLAAFYLKYLRPNRKVVLIERRDTLGGNHTWSIRSSHIKDSTLKWLSPLISHQWNNYEVLFPSFQKKINDSIFAIRSEDLHRSMVSALGSDIWLNCEVKSLSSDCVTTREFRFDTPLVLDARGVTAENANAVGYHKFLGLDLELQGAHGLKSPMLIDSIGQQKDGFRYISLLPWSEFSVLIEDHRYSNFPEINLDNMTKDVLMYAQTRGWQVDKIRWVQRGSLQLPLFLQASQIGPLGPTAPTPIGLAAKYFHYSTGYSLFYALQTTEIIGQLGRWTSGMAIAALKKFDEDFLIKQKYFAMINRMLFLGAKAEERVKIFESVFKQPDDLISNFFAAQLTTSQKLRLFAGKPPVPIHRALKSYFKSNPNS